jgi:hypothetical protein
VKNYEIIISVLILVSLIGAVILVVKWRNGEMNIQNLNDVSELGGGFTMKQGTEVKIDGKVVVLKSLSMTPIHRDKTTGLEVFPKAKYVFVVRNGSSEVEGMLAAPYTPITLDGIKITVAEEIWSENSIVVKIENEIKPVGQ